MGSIHFVNLQIMAELLAAEHIFAHFLDKRPGFVLRAVISGLFCLAAAFLFPMLSENRILLQGILMYASIFLLSGVSMYFSYEEDFWSILFCCICGYTVQHLAASLNAFFTERFPPRLTIYILTLIIPYTFCAMIFSRDFRKHKKVHIDNKRMLLLTGVGLYINLLSGLFVMIISADNPQPDFEMMIHLFSALCCILLLCVQFGLLSSKGLEIELGVVSQMLQEREKQYSLSRSNIDIINQKCHDLKHQIHSLRSGDAVVDDTILKEIEDAVGIYDSAVRTGCAALDVILTEKCLFCEKNNIVLTCMADGEALDFMQPSDIYSLFGNAVDNAVEAVSCLKDRDKRNISLTVRSTGSMVSVNIDNYFEGNLDFQDDIPQTSKEDRSIHGFGMRSMRTISEKYGGFLTASAKDQVFHLNIIIPVSAA